VREVATYARPVEPGAVDQGRGRGQGHDDVPQWATLALR
jgi:hypothetical protein